MREISLLHRLVLSLIGFTLIAAIAAIGVRVALGELDDVYTLRAQFPRTGQGLDSTSSVKIRGVTVGSVSGITLHTDGTAEVTLHLQARYRVPDTVVASAEPLSIFGPKFIRLDPGAHETSGPFLADNASIEHTTSPTEIVDVLGEAARVLNAIDPADLHTVIATLAQGLEGTGPTIGKAVDDVSTLVDVLAKHNGDTRQLLADLATVTRTFAEHGESINATADALHNVLPTLSAHDDDLGLLLDASASTSRTLSALVQGHATALDQVIAGLSPTVRMLDDQLACVPGFLKANADLIGLLGRRLLVYNLPGGQIAGIVSGPASFNRLLSPVPTVVSPPVGLCGSAP
jgi:phospholipid/cholesterol/gamma-HCH transport system substrate-binding protein